MLHPNGSLLLGISRNSQLQIFPFFSCIYISCIAGDKGSYTSEIRRFGLDLLWQKWDPNLVSPFYASDTCQHLLELCLDGDWPGRAGFKKEIKPILSVSRKKKQLFYLLIHTKNPIFLSQKTQGSDFSFWAKLQNETWKAFFPRIFLRGRCTLHPNDDRGLVSCAVPVLHRRMGCISPELQVNKPCLPATFRSGWSVCPSVSAVLLLPMVRICQHFHVKFTGNSSFWLFHYNSLSGCKTHVAERLRERIKGAFLCEISRKSLK